MDEKTRGFIEKSMDYVFMHYITSDVEFVRDVNPFEIIEDIAFGYSLGNLNNQIYFTLMRSLV